ncbi:hypothetical protein BTGOE6_02160 [Bacillus wiedmannii]|nr:hypothetical protein BTGOE6_02160 [Bacillus wiedmannii]
MITCKCGKTIHDEYEGGTYSFGPTIHGLVKKGKARKSYDYHKVCPLSDFLVCLFCCHDKSKLINTIVETYKKFTELEIEKGYIKEKVPKYI